MKIAIYHGFTEIHFEMLGYFIEYIKYSNININIYALCNDIGLSWKEHYNNIFKINLNWINPYYFNPHIYDLIILLADDDLSFKEEWLLEFGNRKVICIDHCGLLRRNNVMERIGTRFFARRPNTHWALPCYYGISKYEKSNLLEKNSSINICCIGIQNRPPDIDFLKILFKDFEKIQFHLIARFFTNKFDEYNNIHIYENCPTSVMFNLIKQSHYILCINNNDNSFPIADSISGAVPLAFSYGCKLILPYIWNQYYNFKSCITYYDPTIQKNGTTELDLLNDKNLNNLDNIYDELYKLILHRNKLFDTLIKNKIDKPLLYNKEYLYIKILLILNYPLPNIIININNNMEYQNLLDLKSYFREIHNFNNNNDNNENDNHYIFYYNDYNNITNLSDSALIDINNNDTNIDKDILILLSYRNYKDVIIFNNTNNINNLLKYYNRYYILYTYEDKIIIIPQF
jgi:hypothetical protein